MALPKVSWLIWVSENLDFMILQKGAFSFENHQTNPFFRFGHRDGGEFCNGIERSSEGVLQCLVSGEKDSLNLPGIAMMS
jgi:hypothetical protein